MSGVSCWKSTVNSSQSLRRLIGVSCLASQLSQEQINKAVVVGKLHQALATHLVADANGGHFEHLQ